MSHDRGTPYTRTTCKYCEQKLPKNFHEKRRKLKGQRVRAALMETKANGENIGRKRQLDYDKILDLRAEGKTMREIAKEMNCSVNPVHYVIHNHQKGKRND